MTILFHLNEIREAAATLSAVHATGEMTRADVNCMVAFIEARCAEIEALAPASAGGLTHLPIYTLAGVAAQLRADGAAAARSHLALVSSGGDAA